MTSALTATNSATLLNHRCNVERKSTFTMDEKQAPLTSNTQGRSSAKRPSPLIQRTAQNHLPSGCIEAARYVFATEATCSAKVHSQRDTMRQSHLRPTRMGGAALSSFRVDATKQHGTSSPLRQRAAQKYIHNRYEEAAPLTSNTHETSSAKLFPSGCIEAAQPSITTDSTHSTKPSPEWMHRSSTILLRH
jgi:hypothetical protein